MKLLIFTVSLAFGFTSAADFVSTNPPLQQVDVIIVVDDSGSMGPYQNTFSANIENIFSDFKDLDTHFGVLTTSTYDPLSAGVFVGDSGTTTAQLQENLAVGTQGYYIEKAFRSLVLALSPPLINKQNKGFLRPGAPLVIVFITDEPEQSELTVNDFLVNLLILKGDLDITVYGYIPKSDDCGRDGPNTKVPDLVNLLGGKTYSICDADWSKNKVTFPLKTGSL